MSIAKIKIGTTGQATPTGPFNGFSGMHIIGYWRIIRDSDGILDSFYSGSQWSLSSTGVVHVPPESDNMGIISPGGFTGYYIYQSYPTTKGEWFAFEAVGLKATVTASKWYTAAIAGTSPQQYKHVYQIGVNVDGGLAPFNYNWSTTVGTLVPASPNQPAVELVVVNTTPDFSGLSGTVSCTVTDSNSPSYSDTDDAELSEARISEQPVPCVPTVVSAKTSECPCENGTCQAQEECIHPDGNNRPSGPGSGGPGSGGPGSGGPGSGCGGGKATVSASHFHAGGGRNGPVGPCGPSGPGSPAGMPSPFGRPTTTRPGTGLN